MSKISELSNGGALLSTDDLIVVRSGGNVRAQLSSLNGIAIGSSTPAAGSFTTLTASGSATLNGGVTIDPADGVADDAYALTVRNNEATDGRNYGLWVRAGSNSSDESFSVRNHDNSATYFKVRGDGAVGVGTSSPQAKLHSYTSGTGSIPTGQFNQTADDNTALTLINANNSATYSAIKLETRESQAAGWMIANEFQSAFNGDLVFRGRDGGTSSAEVLRLKSNSNATFSGSVGIGTSSINANLEIRGSSSNGQVRLGGSTSGVYGKLYSDNDGVFIVSADSGNAAANSYFGVEVDGSEAMRISGGDTTFKTSAGHLSVEALGGGSVLLNSNGSMGMNVASGFSYEIDVGGSEVMRINSTGVGIGQSSPNRNLHVSGGSADTSIGLTNTASGHNAADGFSITIENPTPEVAIRQRQNQPMKFYTNNIERMRIDSSGNITQTFSDGSNVTAGNMPSVTGYTLTNTTNSNGSGAKLEFSLNNGSAKAAIAAEQSAATSSSLNFYTENSGTSAERLRIDAAGAFQIGGTTNAAFIDFDTNALQFNTQRNPNTGAFVNTGKSHAGITLFGGSGDSYIKFYTTNANNSAAPERMRIDSNGRLLVAKSSSAFGTVGHELDALGQVSTTADGRTAVYLNRLSSDGNILQFHKDGTEVGTVVSRGSVATSFVFDPRSNGSGLSGGTRQIQPTNEDGAVVDNILDIGLGTTRFKDIYATNGTIQTSDRNEKQDIEELSDAEQRVAVAAKGLLRKFRWKSSVEEKGDDARIHFGIIAQDLQDAFTAEGLDAGRYAMFISSTWTDEETGEECTRLGVRYSELLAFIISAI